MPEGLRKRRVLPVQCLTDFGVIPAHHSPQRFGFRFLRFQHIQRLFKICGRFLKVFAAVLHLRPV